MTYGRGRAIRATLYLSASHEEVTEMSKTKRELTARQQARKTRKGRASEKRAAEWVEARGGVVHAVKG